jgi:eukaryotic-like serine/threonine-protein kinase
LTVSSPAYALPQRELVLGRYRPLRPLGRGGSGSVWLARDERTGLEVALKIVPREGKRASRAEREVAAATRLRHPRCVRAYDFGGDGNHVYIAYEYVQGRTLREAIRAGELGDREAVEAAAQVLDGLAHAHRKGIVHRDVKPANVLLEDGPTLSVRLLDFGLAQFDEADTLTAVGDVPGTLAYISPERLRGEDATPASDVWAVGVLLWEALAATHPFWGVPLPKVATTIEAGAPPLAGHRPDLPNRLLTVIARALQTDPARRPRASALAAELRAAVEPGRQAARRVGKQAPRPSKLVAAPVRLETRIVPAVLAGVVTAIGGSLLPFWPMSLLAAITLLATAASLRSPRLGLAVALAAPLFPIGNVALGAAMLYGAVAAAWLVLAWRDARTGLLFAVGPLLSAVGALALLPLAVQPARGWMRRAAQAVAGVLAAALVAGLRGSPLPLGSATAGDLGIDASERPAEAGEALLAELAVRPELLTTAAVLATSAALLPTARARGRWGIAALGAGQIAAALVAAPAIPWASFVLCTWLLCAVLAVVRPR